MFPVTFRGKDPGERRWGQSPLTVRRKSSWSSANYIGPTTVISLCTVKKTIQHFVNLAFTDSGHATAAPCCQYIRL